LRQELLKLGDEQGIDVRLPQMQYCLDNAAMIAGLAAVKLHAGQIDDWTLSASPQSTLTAQA
jgi:N6-L-threonylcarbamoyladenine synthase